MLVRHLAIVTTTLAAFALAAPGCDTDTDSGDGGAGAATVCDFGFAVTNDGGKDIGQACAADTECRYGVCLMPGDAGNIENNQFGYCTRGCNCNNSTDSRLSAEDKGYYTCLDPSGFAGKKRHVALLCGSLAACTAVDAGWTSCAAPSTGGVRNICQAQ